MTRTVPAPSVPVDAAPQRIREFRVIRDSFRWARSARRLVRWAVSWQDQRFFVICSSIAPALSFLKPHLLQLALEQRTKHSRYWKRNPNALKDSSKTPASCAPNCVSAESQFLTTVASRLPL